MSMQLILWCLAGFLGAMWFLRRSSKSKNRRGY